MKIHTNTRRKRFLCTLLCALMLTAQVTPGYGEDEIPEETTAYAEETSTVEETFYAEETGMDEETAEEEVLLPAAAQAAVVQSDRMATSADVVIFAYFTDDTAESASAYFNEQGKYSTFKKYLALF